jgi:uncharacterized protein (DUF983 family)
MYGADGVHRLPHTKYDTKGQPPILKAALHGLCPRCGAQSVFAGPAHFHERCADCGYDLAKQEAGGRFAAVVTMSATVILIAIAALIDEVVSPPLWLQAIIWTPLTVLGVVGAVRFAKAGWLALRYAKAQVRESEKG